MNNLELLTLTCPCCGAQWTEATDDPELPTITLCDECYDKLWGELELTD